MPAKTNDRTAEHLLKTHLDPEAVIKQLQDKKMIGPGAARFLRSYTEYGYYSPATTGGYGMSDKLRVLVETHFSTQED